MLAARGREKGDLMIFASARKGGKNSGEND